MNSPDDIFEYLKDILGSSTQDFSILEDNIDVNVQMEYYKLAAQIRSNKLNNDINPKELLSGKLTDDQIKALLIHIAISEGVENYRLIEEYTKIVPGNLKGWALLALNESRFHLVSSLTGNGGVYISTGLGGKNGMLRYFIVLLPSDIAFTKEQQQIIIDEIYFLFKRNGAEVETVEVLDGYICTTALIPMDVAINLPIKMVIDECVKLGCPINEGYIVSNVKKLSLDEINKVINNEPLEGLGFEET